MRVSSGPRRLPIDSSTAATAAVHSGVRFPRTQPALPKVVLTCTNRSSNPSPSSGLGCCARYCSTAALASIVRSSKDAPAAAAASKIWSVSPRSSAGSLRVSQSSWFTHDGEIAPAAIASAR